MDFDDDVVLWGHEPGLLISRWPRAAWVWFRCRSITASPGKGLSIQMSVRRGPVTLLSVVEGRDGVFLLAAEGESVEGKTLQIGNTNSRYRFPIGARAFMDGWAKGRSVASLRDRHGTSFGTGSKNWPFCSAYRS